LTVSNEPLVSSDIVKSPFATIVDLEMTRVVDGDLVKVMAWYDNEWGYSCRVVDLVNYVAQNLTKSSTVKTV
jgi:glyceraldehyde 3-phosphate dehydrogenase